MATTIKKVKKVKKVASTTAAVENTPAKKSLTKVNTANLEKVAKSADPGKVALTKIKYTYPEDADTSEKRKAFRKKARVNFAKLSEAILKGKDEKEIKTARKALAAFVEETYLPAYIKEHSQELVP